MGPKRLIVSARELITRFVSDILEIIVDGPNQVRTVHSNNQNNVICKRPYKSCVIQCCSTLTRLTAELCPTKRFKYGNMIFGKYWTYYSSQRP